MTPPDPHALSPLGSHTAQAAPIVSERRAAGVKFAVDHFGHYYDLEEKLPGVYKFNRSMEIITWTH